MFAIALNLLTLLKVLKVLRNKPRERSNIAR